jgi:predicted HTH transcriptional regulator
MLISIEGHSVTDFDTQSALNRWWTTPQTLSRPVIINTNRHYDYDIFNRQINIHLDIKSLVSNNVIMVVNVQIPPSVSTIILSGWTQSFVGLHS